MYSDSETNDHPKKGHRPSEFGNGHAPLGHDSNPREIVLIYVVV